MTPDDARDDLAFLRGLVAPGERDLRTFGEIYAAGGLCYGVQMLGHGAEILGLLPGQGPVALAIAFGPTVVFAGLLTWILSRPRARQATVGVNRAVRLVFRAIGTAALALMVVIGSAALRRHDVTIWLIYPCVVMVLQGAAWLVAANLWRRTWMLVVALGWFAVGIGAGLAVQAIPAFVAIIGAGLIGFMLVPGLIMMRPRAAP
jgi:hypothetical protein